MKRVIITVGAALLVAGPVTLGVIGNTTFAQSVPVRIPAHAKLLEDHGGPRATPDRPTSEPDDHLGVQRFTFEPGHDKASLQDTGASESGGGKHGTQNDSVPAKEDNGGHGRNVDGTSGGKDDGAGHR